MKKVSPVIVMLTFILLVASCKSDDGADDLVNVPPTQATNINAEVVPNSARIAITWDAASDENGDQIKYDVVINNELVKTNLSTTSTEVDISQFLSTTSKRGLAQSAVGKSVEVTLNIEIKAYDPSNSFSNASVTKTFTIDRAPSDFAFENIEFDTDSYNSLDITWIPATDSDGDSLSYTVYLNEIVLAENYEIPSDEDLGSVSYTEDFFELSNSEIIVKVVVTDSSGRTKEISQSFNFKETDVDLGVLELPYNAELSFSIVAAEPDNQVGYQFSITEQINYTIGNSENSTMQIKDAGNNILISDAALEGVLESGEYTLIISGDESSATSGTISFDITASSSTDVNLGILSIPYQETFDVVFDSEEDNIVNYLFEITEPTGYIFTGPFEKTLYDEAGNEVVNDDDDGFGTFPAWDYEIPQGKYRIEIKSGDNSNGDLSIYLKNSTQSDQDLGVLDNNTTHELNFEPDTDFDFEPDRNVKIIFEVQEQTGLIIAPNFDPSTGLTIRDAEGVIIDFVDLTNYKKIVEFEPGTYSLYIDYAQFFGLRAVNQELILQEPTLTDADWGIISTPVDINGNTLVEPDDQVVYTFETTEVSPRWYYSTSDNSGDTVSFTDEAGNEVPRDGDHPSGEGEAGVNLPPGKYRIVVTDGQGANSPGYGVSFRFNLY